MARVQSIRSTPGRQLTAPDVVAIIAAQLVARAGVAQLVEHHVANVVVDGSNPFARSIRCGLAVCAVVARAAAFFITTTEEGSRLMSVQLEDVGPCKKLLKVEVPKEKVDEELDKSYLQLNESAAIPGFRKGHVPRWLMESRYGKQVSDDTKDSLVAEALSDALKEKELRPIGPPTFDENIELKPGEPLAFGVTIEVHPDFELEDCANLSLEKTTTEPTKAEVDERIKLIRKRYAKLEDVAEGAPKSDDVVRAHVTLREGDNVYRDIPEHQFILGEHALVGMTGDDTTKFLTKAKIGDTVEKTVTLPDEYPDEAKRGAEMSLSMKIEGIRRPVLPKATAKWAKELGFESLEEFHEEVQASVQREKDQAAKSDLERQMVEQLLTKADFDLPEGVITNMAEGRVVRHRLRLRQQGVPDAEIEKHLDKMQAESRDQAEKEAKLYFILDKVADKERIFVTEEEVTARIEAMAAHYGRSVDQVRRELENEDRLSELRTTMREEKVKAFLLEKAEVKEPKPHTKEAAKSKE